MTVAKRTIKVDNKLLLQKYILVANECCNTSVKGESHKVVFTFQSEEDAEIFDRIISNLVIFQKTT
jgi:hypothetical protein